MQGERVGKVDARGVVSTVAGTGTKGNGGDGGPARDASFNGMHNLVATPDGDLLLADTWNNRVRKLDAKTGKVTAMIGTGVKGFSGDDGPADKAQFGGIYCLALDAGGQAALHRRPGQSPHPHGRSQDQHGEHGGGQRRQGHSRGRRPGGQGSPGRSPAVAVDAKGNVWILERSGHALRVVDRQGKIRTVVGTGKPGAGGDGGPARQATLNGPKHLCVDRDGNVLIADTENHLIRKYVVSEDKLVRVAGTGKKGSAGLGGPPDKAELSQPHGVYVHPSGASSSPTAAITGS